MERNQFSNVYTVPPQPAVAFQSEVQPVSPQEVTTQEVSPKTSGNLAIQLVYPEIFYRVQPFIILVCDQFENYNITPTQDMIEQFSNSLCTELCQIYPDLKNYNYNRANNDDPPFMSEYGLRRPDHNQDLFLRRFRQRGSLNDLISILLLSEIFRRH